MKRVFAVLASVVVTLLPAAGPRAADATVTISQGVDADTLNPIATTITPTFNVVQHVYERLADFGARPGDYEPRLALSWRRVNPTTEEYKLRRGVTFSNGDPFTSADVRYTVDWIKNPANASKQTPYVRDIDRVETPDPYTVRLISKVPTAIPPGLQNPLFIVDAKYFQAKGNAYVAEHPIGTGPYVLREWKRDDLTAFDANPHWWGGKPKVEHVIFKPIPEAAARVAALRTGATDVITNVPPQYQIQLTGGTNTKLVSTRSLRQLFIAFNTLQPGPQQNKLVRQAINYAVDVPAIVKNVLGGRGYEIASPIPPNYFGYDPSVPAYPHDLAKAKALLAKAGFPDGKGIALTVNAPIGRYNRDREVAEAVAGQLQAAGITATVRPQEWVTYSDQVNRRALTPLYELGWNQPSADADGIITALFTSNAPLSCYANPEIDKLADQARGELDVAKRKALYKRIATILHEDAPWIVLFEYEDLYATSKRVQWQPRGDEYIRAYEMSLT
ncbi:ABC transporter substrate-binding protein [Vulcanimicrobium alpinum]|uniref:ABC transporter substrate-binding protein n=1 Tax=Vulcanimicrobium alpinum TaxID=3016050 RepID=A0AAN1XW52_UNVUL|nr:ABC transporter substrate-binding protein [Vulcanimicrobium alpinum]BDE05601.1 ABC transporter substrate-binding protein [Vulcanimicrobium alpinum]